MEIKYIGKRIKEKRLERSWSQEELAEKVNLSPVYIGMIERGEKVPKLETFVRIANVLKVTTDELLQDVLVQGYIIKASLLSDKIEKLDDNEKNKLYKLINVFLS